MGEGYKRLGLTVGYILNSMDNMKRREMYNRDITYGTNNEFGFDYLRDNMALQSEEKVQRGHSFAIVDDLLATGGTVNCVSDLLNNYNKKVVGLLVVVELNKLNGRSRFNFPVESSILI